MIKKIPTFTALALIAAFGLSACSTQKMPEPTLPGDRPAASASQSAAADSGEAVEVESEEDKKKREEAQKTGEITAENPRGVKIEEKDGGDTIIVSEEVSPDKPFGFDIKAVSGERYVAKELLEAYKGREEVLRQGIKLALVEKQNYYAKDLLLPRDISLDEGKVMAGAEEVMDHSLWEALNEHYKADIAEMKTAHMPTFYSTTITVEGNQEKLSGDQSAVWKIGNPITAGWVNADGKVNASKISVETKEIALVKLESGKYVEISFDVALDLINTNSGEKQPWRLLDSEWSITDIKYSDTSYADMPTEGQ